MKGKNWEEQRKVIEMGWVVFQKERDLSLRRTERRLVCPL